MNAIFQLRHQIHDEFVSEKEAVKSKLQTICQQLTIEDFAEIALAVHFQTQHIDHDYAPAYRASSLQGEMLGMTRKKLAAYGWKNQDVQGGGGLSVSPDDKIAIAVITGTQETGQAFGIPTNTALKGTMLENAIAKKTFTDLFGKMSVDGIQLWLLIFHHRGSTVQMELSRPSEFHNGRIGAFAERIALPTVNLDASVSITKKNNGNLADTADVAEIKIERRRKAA